MPHLNPTLRLSGACRCKIDQREGGEIHPVDCHEMWGNVNPQFMNLNILAIVVMFSSTAICLSCDKLRTVDVYTMAPATVRSAALAYYVTTDETTARPRPRRLINDFDEMMERLALFKSSKSHGPGSGIYGASPIIGLS